MGETTGKASADCLCFLWRALLQSEKRRPDQLNHAQQGAPVTFNITGKHHEMR